MDLDLRSASEVGTYTYPLGSDVTHIFCDARPYTATFHGPGKNAVYQIFTALADQSNYPVYMHCTYGADRTGTLIFLLQGVLGVSEADMQREYRTTGFAMSGYDTSDNLDVIIAGLENFPGDTTQEKIVYYLTNTVGVTQEEIDSIRTILLEE